MYVLCDAYATKSFMNNRPLRTSDFLRKVVQNLDNSSSVDGTYLIEAPPGLYCDRA